MKRLLRLIIRPGVFFNQLQWSRAHWFILGAFALMATLETSLGQYTTLYLTLSSWLRVEFGLPLSQAVWVITAGKLAVMMLGSYVAANLIWRLGNLLGEAGSQRVLFRRLAIVFTVLLMGNTARHLAIQNELFYFLAVGIFAWATLLGFYAIQQQFQLNVIETALVTALVALSLTSAVHYSGHAIDMVAKANGIHPSAPALTSPLDDEYLRFENVE